jgi:hypothetical protein
MTVRSKSESEATALIWPPGCCPQRNLIRMAMTGLSRSRRRSRFRASDPDHARLEPECHGTERSRCETWPGRFQRLADCSEKDSCRAHACPERSRKWPKSAEERQRGARGKHTNTVSRSQEAAGIQAAEHDSGGSQWGCGPSRSAGSVACQVSCRLDEVRCYAMILRDWRATCQAPVGSHESYALR